MEFSHVGSRCAVETCRLQGKRPAKSVSCNGGITLETSDLPFSVHTTLVVLFHLQYTTIRTLGRLVYPQISFPSNALVAKTFAWTIESRARTLVREKVISTVEFSNVQFVQKSYGANPGSRLMSNFLGTP